MPSISIPRGTSASELAWGQNFVTKLEADPGAFMVDPPTIADLRMLVDAFQAAYDAAGVLNRLAVDPGSYTQPQRAALQAARNNFMGEASQVSFQIHANSAVSDADKLDAGVAPRNFDRQPIPAPSSQPLIDVQDAQSGVHQLVYTDINTPDSKAKPFGVTQILLYVAITEIGESPTFNDAHFYGAFTKNPIVVGFDQADNGKKATYFARWMNKKGNMGPVSASVSATIMFST